jgi:hypothetical protein
LNMKSVQACPECGCSRFKRAPLLLLAVFEPIVRRWRYRCAGCGWIGWMHRLERQVKPPSPGFER